MNGAAIIALAIFVLRKRGTQCEKRGSGQWLCGSYTREWCAPCLRRKAIDLLKAER